MADLSKIVDQLSELTVLEAAELSKLLEEKWGVSAAAPVAVAAVAGGGDADLGADDALDSGLDDAMPDDAADDDAGFDALDESDEDPFNLDDL